MEAERLATTPRGNLTVDVLKQAYMRASFPSPFSKEHGDSALAELIHARMALVSFSDYWSSKFEDYGENFNGNPAGLFAQNSFRAAEQQDGDELLLKVATELAGSFAEDMFEAEIDIPEIKGVEMVVTEGFGPLAQFLVEFRREMEGGSIPLSPRPRKISESWITFSHVLAVSDPTQHDTILEEVVGKYRETDVWIGREMELWEGMMGGFNSWDREHALITDIAEIYASHFPQIIVSRLQTPTQLYTWTRSDPLSSEEVVYSI